MASDAGVKASRAATVATLTMFFDVAQGLGAALLGQVARPWSDCWATFGVGAVTALLSLAVLRLRVIPCGPRVTGSGEVPEPTAGAQGPLPIPD